MVYNVALWGESQQANGLTATAALANQYFANTGDILKMKGDIPRVIGLGMVSATKPNGCQLIPKNQQSSMPIKGPGGIDLIGNGFNFGMRKQPRALFADDEITGYTDNTNVDEAALCIAEIVESEADLVIPPPKKYAEVIYDEINITVANALTVHDASDTLDELLVNYSKWIDPAASYDIIGSYPISGQLVTLGGCFTFRNLSNAWKGMLPGVLVNPLSAVTFNSGSGPYYCPQPIPIEPDQFISVTGGHCTTGTGAAKFGLIIGRK